MTDTSQHTQPIGDVVPLYPPRGTKEVMAFMAKDADTLRTVLRYEGLVVRYSTRSHQIEWSEGTHDLEGNATGRLAPWRKLDDRKEANLRDGISKRYKYATSREMKPLRFGKDAWHDALNAIVHSLELDPFASWLSDLPEWDGVPRIDSMLVELFGCEDTATNRWASRFLTLGAVQRTLRPGCKLDEMPVLIGRQGLGKSSLLRSLLPPQHPEWASDGLHLAAPTKERAEALLGRVIVEASEMAGANRGRADIAQGVCVPARRRRCQTRVQTESRDDPAPLHHRRNDRSSRMHT